MPTTMGRLTKHSSSSSNPDPTISEIFRDLISKHRSCWLHEAAYLYRRKKRITLREVREIKKRFRHASPCFYQSFPHRERSNWMNYHASSTTGDRKKLDTGIFEQCMEGLWRSFPEDKRMSFEYLDSLWFSLYRNATERPKVLTWIKQKGIFSKKYVFVPIVCWSHWSLLIFVHLGESSNSESGTPCMLLLDSLEAADPRRLEPEIRNLVEKKSETVCKVFSCSLFKVPQQKNEVECGNYVLYFINLFMKAAPEYFSISEGYPYFMRRDWFDPKSYAYFCSMLEKQLSKRSQETSTSCTSPQKYQKKDGVVTLDDD